MAKRWTPEEEAKWKEYLACKTDEAPSLRSDRAVRERIRYPDKAHTTKEAGQKAWNVARGFFDRVPFLGEGTHRDFAEGVICAVQLEFHFKSPSWDPVFREAVRTARLALEQVSSPQDEAQPAFAPSPQPSAEAGTQNLSGFEKST